MTEAEWLACTNPFKMSAFLRGKVSDRKLRLFAVACCRLIWNHMKNEKSRNLVEVAQRFADGKATGGELAEARNAAPSTSFPSNGFPYPDELAEITAAESAAESIDTERVIYAAFFDGGMITEGEDGDLLAAILYREIFGNPFRPPSPLPPAVLAWNDSTVRRLAEGIYEERAFERLPILADALIDAGYEQEELVGHFRSEEKHVRGCWGVDLVLGRS